MPRSLQRKNRGEHNCSCLQREFLTVFVRACPEPPFWAGKGGHGVSVSVEIRFKTRSPPGRCAAQPRSCAVFLSPQNTPSLPTAKAALAVLCPRAPWARTGGFCSTRDLLAPGFCSPGRAVPPGTSPFSASLPVPAASSPPVLPGWLCPLGR